MLPKKYRLKKKTDIEKVFKKGKAFNGDFLILKIARNALDYSRVSCLVSKKVAKKATSRNSIRRKTIEAIRPDLVKIKNGFDIIFIAKKGLEGKSFQDSRIMLNKALSLAKLL